MKNVWKLKKILTISLAAASILSCQGNKSSDNTPAVAPAPAVTPAANAVANPYLSNLYSNTGCTVAASSGTQLLVAPSEATYTNFGAVGGSFNMKFCLQLLGDATQIQQIQSTNHSAPYYYNGAIALGGTLTLANPGTMGSCVLPAGTYTINTTATGLYSPISFEVPQFEAVSGSTKIIFQLRQGWTKDPNADNFIDRLALDVVALAVQVNGNVQSTCNDIQGLFLN